MARSLTELPFVPLALGLWILACPTSLAKSDDLKVLSKHVNKLFTQGKEALRIYQKVLGKEHPDTATSLNNLAELYLEMGEYAKAEPLLREATRILQKILGSEHPDTTEILDNLAYCEFDLGRIDEATALARQASAAALTFLSKIFSFTSEEQRLAYLEIFDPYRLFPFLEGTETDLAAAVLRYKGVVLDSIVEDRLQAEASQGSKDQKLVQQLNLDKKQLGQLLLQPAQKLSIETNQRIERLEAEVEKIESQLAQHVAGLGQARHALDVSPEQVQSTIPNDGALIEYLLKIHSPYILHLATHGFFAKEDPTTNQTDPEESLNDRQSVTKSRFFKNPMHRSGLALAGAQTTVEAWKRDEVPPVENDGILTAEDVSTLDLQGRDCLQMTLRR
jgi:tetratricopeptide (TPR) repeat protein